MRYRLTLKNIRQNMDSQQPSGRPLFRFVYNLKQNEFPLISAKDNSQCPLEDTPRFRMDLEKCFSRKDNSKQTAMNNANMVYFLMGGNCRLVSDTPLLSRLVNANPRTTKDLDPLVYDLTYWKAVLDKDGGWSFENCGDKKVPNGALPLIEYIIQMNDEIIRNFCSQKSQEGLRVMLRDYVMSICEAESVDPEWIGAMPIKLARTVIMDPELVEMLAELLDILTRLAEASGHSEMKPRYLAEGLTWLLAAALLRGKFSALQGELTAAKRRAQQEAGRMGIIKTDDIRSGKVKPLPDPTAELYGRLMDRFRYARDQHPSIRMMTPDPSLFPKGLPTIGNVDRTAVEGKEAPLSIKDMVMKSWADPSHKHLLLVGEGGIGKTVAMLQLPGEAWIKKLKIPAVYVPLQSLDIYEGNLGAYIRDSFGSDAERIMDLAGGPWEGHPRLLLLLDGFNEIPIDYKQTAEKHIRMWMDKPGVQVITTSRISFTLNRKFLEYTLQPLPYETSRKYLLSAGISEDDLPSPNDNVWRVINVPLMLAMFTQIDKVREITKDSAISDYLEWKESDNAAHIIWNYLQVELYRLINADESSCVLSAAAVLAIAPYVCYEMAKTGKYYVEQENYQIIIQKAVQFYSQNKFILSQQIKRICYKFDKLRKEMLFGDNAWEDYFIILSERSVLFNEKENSDNSGKHEIVYVATHQNFRDILAAIFISECMINSIRKEGTPLFLEEVLTTADFYVKDYVSEFLPDDEQMEIWDYNRANSPDNGRVTRFLMDIIGRKRNYDYRELNFSSLDLSHINLYEFVSKRTDICPLSNKAAFFINTKILMKNFLPESHSDTVTSIAFSPNGRLLASGSVDCTVRIWDLNSGTCKVLEGHTKRVTSVAFSPNGNQLASSSIDRTVRIWDISSGNVQILENSLFFATSVTFSSNGKFLACGLYKALHVWDLEKGNFRTLSVNCGAVTSVVFSPDGRLLAFGTDDNYAQVWNLADTSKQVFLYHNSMVTSVTFSPDGRLLACGSIDKTVQIFDLQYNNKNPKMILQVHNPVTSLAFSPDGKWLAIGTKNPCTKLWGIENNTCVLIEGHSDAITSVAFSHDGRQLASGSIDQTVLIWDFDSVARQQLEGNLNQGNGAVNNLDEERTARSLYGGIPKPNLKLGGKQLLENYSSGITGVAFSLDGELLVSGSADCTVRIWNLKNGTCRVLEGHTAPVRSVVFSADGKLLASGSEDCTIRIWNLKNGTCRVLEGHTAPVRSVMFSADGKLLASGSTDATARVWNIKDGTCLFLKEHTNYVKSEPFILDEKSLSNTLYNEAAWDLNNDKNDVFENLPQIISVSLSPDGRFLACGLSDSVIDKKRLTYTLILIWDLKNGTSRALEGHSFRVNSVLFSPNGKYLASGSDDTFVLVWNLARDDNKPEIILESHHSVTSVAFSPDGRYLACGSSGKNVRVWNLKNNTDCVLKGHSDEVTSVAFSPIGRFIASGSRDGSIQIWDYINMIPIKKIRGIKNINLCGANFERAIISEKDKKMFMETGVKIRKR